MNRVKINPLVTAVKKSGTLRINEQVKALRTAGKQVYHFGFGQSPFPVHPRIIQALSEHTPYGHYLSTGGLMMLREALSDFLKRYQGISFPPERLFIGPGSKILLQQIIYLLEARFLIPQGSWVSYIPQILIRGGHYEIIPTRLSDQYKVRPEVLDAIAKKYVDDQLVLILNSPNNPTGAVYSSEELKAVARVAERYGMIILSDEIYTQLDFNNDFSPSMAPIYPDGTIVFGGLSKLFSAGGYRLGFVGIPQRLSQLISPLLALISETYSAVSTPIQYGAVVAYQDYEQIKHSIDQQKAVLKHAFSVVARELKEAGVRLTSSQGGFYCVVDFEPYRNVLRKNGILNAIDLTQILLDQYDVALLPGQDFAFERNTLTCRLAFVDFDGAAVLRRWDKHPDALEAVFDQTAPQIRKGAQSIAEFLYALNGV